MIFEHDDLASAVLFFNDTDSIIKSMNITEFDAVLEGYIPLSDLSSRNINCVYVEFDCDFIVRTTIFFNLLISASGEIDKSWRLPLVHLAQVAAPIGPDLGAGKVKLVCYSQSPTEHFKDQLWNPNFETLTTFKQIKKHIAQNRLSVQFRAKPAHHQGLMTTIVDQNRMEFEVSQRLKKEYADEFKRNMDQLLQEQRFKLSALHDQNDEQITLVKKDYSERFENLKNELRDNQYELEESRRLNEHFKSTIEGQAEKISGLREYFEHKLTSAQEGQSQTEDYLKEHYDVEMTARVEAAVSEYKEMLHMREVELLYRNEQESQLRDEINRLRAENQELVTGSGDQLLLKMIEKGISLVSYQPGAGHLTLPMSDLARYMENPVAYTAEHCGVSEERYNAWLIHFNMPVCDTRLEGSNICGENVERIDHPSDFHMDESNRCEKHCKHPSRPHLRIAGE